MYPELPNSLTELVPLPLCDGPKLKPFKFHGDVQSITFVELLGEGAHSRVFKVEINNKLYALKLFCFRSDNWYGLGRVDCKDKEAMTALAQYSEPFYAECRAFGRIQEAAQEAIAIKCYGYVLLDDEHERKLGYTILDADAEYFEPMEFNGDSGGCHPEDFRGRFLGPQQRRPPVRGIVKELGQWSEGITLDFVRSAERDITKLHQLGIISLDFHFGQIIDGRFCDFSMAITTPHPAMTPELNPSLSEQDVREVADETFRLARSDFCQLDEAVQRHNQWIREWSHEKNPRGQLKFRCIEPARNHHDLRPTESRQALYTFADPRIYDWRLSSIASTTGMENPSRRPSPSNGRSSIVTIDGRWRPPKRWYRDLSAIEAQRVRAYSCHDPRLAWEYRDGLLYPHVTFYRGCRLDEQ